jgi:biotin carboxyl carrier protein
VALSPEDIRALISAFQTSDWDEMSLQYGDTRLDLTRNGHPPVGRQNAPVAAAPAAAPVAATAPAAPAAATRSENSTPRMLKYARIVCRFPAPAMRPAPTKELSVPMLNPSPQ